jgi:hypothetical protein
VAAVAVRPRGLLATQVFIVDVNQTSLSFSGLSVTNIAPEHQLFVQFTVSHYRPPTGVELFPATDVFSGVVTQTSNNVVRLALDSAKVSLYYGRYVAVGLVSQGVVPLDLANQQITVYVGPSTLVQAATLNQALYGTSGMLAKTVNVPAAGAAPTASLASAPWYVYAGAAVGVVGAGAAGYFAYRRLRAG